MRSSYLLYITVIITLTVYSCKEKGGKYIDQGEIQYNISYTGDVSLPKELLPQNLIVSFKKDRIIYEMIGIGNSGIVNLSNPEKGIYDTYYSFFTKKYFYAAEPGELYPGFEPMDGMIVRKTLQKSVICGFNCKKAEVTFPSDREKVFIIWYTNEIKVKNPNACNPFNQIDGILMSFFFFLGEAELNFVAENVYKKKIPDEAFERKENYSRVSKEEIKKFIDMMISW